MNKGKWLVALVAGLASACVAAQADTWPMRQKDAQHTGRVNYIVPSDRLTGGSFFDVFLWQKPSPGAPGEGRFDAAQMVFCDGAGPGGADIIVGTYHWPKGLQGMDRQTGKTFWFGLPEGGESVAQRTPAFSPGGDVLYFTNDATSHPLMAFPTAVGPSVYWHNGGNPVPENLGMLSPVVGSDGRIFLHPWVGKPFAGVDDGSQIFEAWEAWTDHSMGYSDVALYDDSGALIVVATARDDWGVKAYDGASGEELWMMYTPSTDAGATIDPDNGNIYFGSGFDSTWVVGLDKYGQPLWDEPFKLLHDFFPGVNNPHWAGSMGCLSWDGGTYYFQTVSESGDGVLYAINTADGSVKWTYPTNARGWEGILPSPVVTPNGVIVIGNNDTTYYALQDAGSTATLIDTLMVSTEGQANGTATIAADGIMYLPVRTVWSAGNGDSEPISGAVSNVFTAFDLRSGAQAPPWPPQQQRAFIRNHAVLVKWKPVDNPGLDHYLVYRAEYPFTSVSGLAPIATVTDPTAGSYLDGTANNGTSYYYAVTCVQADGTEYKGVVSVGPRTPRDETDLQVVSIERTPLYPDYDVQDSWEMVTEPSGFGPYYYNRPTGLGSGQDEFTQRWPLVGETVTYTATVRNRGTNPWSGELDAVWTIDGMPTGDFQVVTLEPGGTATFSTGDQNWDGSLHTIQFEILPGDGRPQNDAVTINSLSVPMLSFIDASLMEEFREKTPNWAGATTDDAIDYLNHQAARMSQMFAERGSQKRVHFGVLEVLDDPDPSPVVDPLLHTRWPDRWRIGQYPLRGSTGYRPADDVDYQLIHEWGHLIGLFLSQLMNIPPEWNEVSFTGFTGPIGAMNNDPYMPFFSPHCASAMQRRLNILPGYHGEYLYDIPAQVRVRVLDFEGQPLPGAQITVYQPLDLGGKRVKRDEIKAAGVTGPDGVFELPNVTLNPSLLPRTFIGAELHDNPFGYVDRLGTNGVLLLKIAKDDQTDFAWLDLPEVNAAYWGGATLSATFDKATALGGPVQVCTLSDMAEMNAADWSGWSAGGGVVSIADDPVLKAAGASSVRLQSTGCFENWFRYPEGRLARWDLSQSQVLRFRMYQIEGPRFQDSPKVRLIGPDGYIDLRYNGALGDLMGQAYGQWFEVEVPLAGDFAWERTDHGTVSLSEINHLEIFADVWGCDFTLWIDGLKFDPGVEIPSARLQLMGNSPTTVSWEIIDGVVSYDVGRGLISELGPGQYGPCFRNDLEGLSVDDSDTPPAGESYFYLVRGNKTGCPSNWGYDSAGQERVNYDPAACP